MSGNLSNINKLSCNILVLKEKLVKHLKLALLEPHLVKSRAKIGNAQSKFNFCGNNKMRS